MSRTTNSLRNASAAIGESGMVLDSAVIPNPDKSLWDSIL